MILFCDNSHLVLFNFHLSFFAGLAESLESRTGRIERYTTHSTLQHENSTDVLVRSVLDSVDRLSLLLQRRSNLASSKY